MYCTIHHHSYDNLLQNLHTHESSILSSSDEQDCNIPFIERPATPFPGQMFHGQKQQHDFNDYLIELFNATIKYKTLTYFDIDNIYNILKFDFNDVSVLGSILHKHLTPGLYVTVDIVDTLRQELMFNAYTKIPFTLSHSLYFNVKQ